MIDYIVSGLCIGFAYLYGVALSHLHRRKGVKVVLTERILMGSSLLVGLGVWFLPNDFLRIAGLLTIPTLAFAINLRNMNLVPTWKIPIGTLSMVVGGWLLKKGYLTPSLMERLLGFLMVLAGLGLWIASISNRLSSALKLMMTLLKNRGSG